MLIEQATAQAPELSEREEHEGQPEEAASREHAA